MSLGAATVKKFSRAASCAYILDRSAQAESLRLLTMRGIGVCGQAIFAVKPDQGQPLDALTCIHVEELTVSPEKGHIGREDVS